jgi:transcriptional regulator with XRE-family HTH domain
MDRHDNVTKKGGDRTPADAARQALQADVGARIRSVRKRLGVGQAECARGAGIDVSSLFRIEKTGQNLTVETLGRLAISLGVTMDELVLGIIPDPDLIEPRSRG